MTKNTNSNFQPGVYYAVLDKRWSNVVQTPGRRKGRAVYLVISYEIKATGDANLSSHRRTSTLKRLRGYKYLSSESAGANEKDFVQSMIAGNTNSIHIRLEKNRVFKDQEELFKVLNDSLAWLKKHRVDIPQEVLQKLE
ncbi:MAG: hypothetical protein WC229_00360 [Candidatus Paceibacterota bacterium]|jgi:hypothetical protein